MTNEPGSSSQEIERTYLLDALPPLPAHARAWRIEQGYLPESDDSPDTLRGRLRRVTAPDGTVTYEHCIKEGSGMIRTERQRALTAEEFELHWPRTKQRRLMKTRHVVTCGHGDDQRTWEIDAFDDLDLVLAEVELPSPEAAAPLPGWLRPHIVREVTDEKSYRNYELALRLAGSAGTHRDTASAPPEA